MIIGAGASGAAAAWSLGKAGFKVVILEQGDWVDYAEAPAAKDTWEVIRQRDWNPNPNFRINAADYPVNVDDTPIHPLMYNAVGGSTIMWSCHNPRFRPSDFKVQSLDGVGADWPISYEDLAPFYELNDRMSGVSGLAGDPAFPEREPRPMPPIPLGKGPEKIAKACNALGWHWWPADIQINATPYGDGRGECNHCGPCELGCPFGAKGSTDFTYVPLAQKYDVEMVTGARVFEIETDHDGRATGAAYFDRNGETRRVRADVVIIAANGIGTPRLMLMSQSRAHPNGLANSSDALGRHLMFHPVAVVTGLFDDPLDGYRGITACSIASQEFYETDPDRDFVRGYMIQMLRHHGPLLTALQSYGVPIGWGKDHHRRFVEVFNHTVAAGVVAEDLPNPDNRVTLDPELTDTSGLPAPKVAYQYDDNAKKMVAHGIARSEELMRTAGAKEVHVIPEVQQAGFHLMGTARIGDNRANSVVNGWGQTHDVENLFVIDGSVFASAAAVNPTSTIQAFALRAAAHIADTRREL